MPKLVILVLVLAVLGLALMATRDIRRRRRTDREWSEPSTALLAARIDVARLTAVRREHGELVAIKAVRDQLPGCPLARARDLVAELTGVPSGSR